MKTFFKSKRFILLLVIFVIFATLLVLSFIISYYAKPVEGKENKEDNINCVYQIEKDSLLSYEDN